MFECMAKMLWERYTDTNLFLAIIPSLRALMKIDLCQISFLVSLVYTNLF